MGLSMMDYINARIKAEESGEITLGEFTDAMQSGDPDQIETALERMEAAGGYDNLE